VDNNCVGWYSSSYLGTFCTPWFVQTQFTYQDNLGPNAVVVVFDPLLTSRGSLAIKVVYAALAAAATAGGWAATVRVRSTCRCARRRCA
ncbi:MAG: hypothetical protein ACK4ZJ_17615, partial [Allorhizobium sp.]